MANNEFMDSPIRRVEAAIAQMIGADALSENQNRQKIRIVTSEMVPQLAQPQLAQLQVNAFQYSIKDDPERYEAFQRHLAEKKATLQRQVAAMGEVEYGAIFLHKEADVLAQTGMRWQMVLPDASAPGSWRTQSFDLNGFSGHMTFDSKQQAMEHAATTGHVVRDDEALDRLQTTPKFQRGLYAADLVMQVNLNKISFKEANEKLAEYDLLQNSLKSTIERGAQAFYDPKSDALYLVADRIKPGDEAAVFLHETIHRWSKGANADANSDAKADASWSQVVDQLKSWERRDPSSLENLVFARASGRVAAAQTPSKHADEELVAYAVEESLALGVRPSAQAHPDTAPAWLDAVTRSLRQVLSQALKVDEDLQKTLPIRPQDLVDMAYAVAQLNSPQRVERVMSVFDAKEQAALQDLMDKIHKKPSDPDLLSQARPGVDQLGFYSELQYQISRSNTKSAAPEQWQGFITGLSKKGVKKDEVQWSGVMDFLDLQQEKVTKEALLDYLSQGGLKLQEVVYRNGENPEDQETKYEKYRLQGGENYRELLLKLPDRREFTLDKSNVVPNQGHGSRPDLFWYFEAPDNVYSISKMKYPEQEDALDHIIREKQPAPSVQDNFKSRHWSPLNVVAHMRVDDHIDAEGRKTLMIHEIQSDWGQEGKRVGFANEKGLLPARPEEYRDIVVGDEIQGWGKVQGIRTNEAGTLDFDVGSLWIGQDRFALDRVADRNYGLLNPGLNTQKLPEGPFVTTTDGWLNLALKRVISLAAEEGYDRVAFINGEQAAARYDLSRQVGEIAYDPTLNGGTLIADPLKKGPATPPVIDESNVKPEDLPKFVGKAVADLLLNNPTERDGTTSVVRGTDLRVGGEGMQVFYDKIVPQALKGLLKKLGDTAPEPLALGTTDDPLNSPHTQLGFTLNDKLRQSCLQGLPMFSYALSSDDMLGNFKTWSKDLPVSQEGLNDYAGGPAVFMAYHGSTYSEITSFERRGNSGGFLGAGSYFSTSTSDVNTNYAGVGPDLASNLTRREEDIANQIYDDPYVKSELIQDYFDAKGIEIDLDDLSDDEFELLADEHEKNAIEWQAAKDLKGDSDGVVYPVFVKFENPADTVTYGVQLTYDINIDDEGDILSETGTLTDWIKNAREVCKSYGVYAENYVDALLLEARDEGSISMKEVFSITLKELEEGYDHSGEAVMAGGLFAEIAEASGFDGVIMDADLHFGSGRRGFGGVKCNMEGVQSDTLHIMPFSSAQVKSVFNIGTFSPDSDDIRYSIATDQKSVDSSKIDLDSSAGAASKADAGFTAIVYHGSDVGNISVFNTNAEENPGERGTFFSKNKEAASGYGDYVYTAEVSLNNPYVVSSSQWAAGAGLSPTEARENGHDGYVIRRMDGINGDAVVAFSPEQIRILKVESTIDPDADAVRKAERAMDFIMESTHHYRKLNI